MPKTKSVSSAKKRFKVTASGKVKRKKCGMRHNLGHKNAKRKRILQHDTLVASTHEAAVKQMLQA
jgi:large subunit ribosomal protein L35